MTNKVTLHQLWARLEAAGHDAAAVRARVQRVVALTLAAMQPVAAQRFENARLRRAAAARQHRLLRRHSLAPGCTLRPVEARQPKSLLPEVGRLS